MINMSNNLLNSLIGLETDADRSFYVRNKKAVIIANNTGSSHLVGTKVTLISYTGGYVYYNILGDATKSLYSKSASELRLEGTTLEDLETENNELQKMIDENNLKIKFLVDNKIKEFDEIDFKVFKTLEVLDNPELGIIAMVKAISKLIKEGF